MTMNSGLKINFIKKITFFVLLILFSTNLFSQKNQYLDGYIITQNLDTIYGQILYQNNQITPKIIQLKNGSKKTYNSNEIQYVEIFGKVKYFSKKVKYSINPHNIQDITADKEIIWKESREFLKAIILGKINLYKFVEKNGKTHFFINKDNEELKDLIVLKYKVDGKTSVKNKYKNDLKKVLEDCSELFKLIDKSKLNQKSLQSIVKQYNDCNNLESTYIAKQPKLGLEIYLKGGLNSSKRYSRHNRTNNLGGEVNFDIVLPINNKVWGITNGIGYRTIKGPIGLSVNSRIVNFNYIRYNLGIKRIIWNKKLRLGLNSGMINSLIIKKPYQGLLTYSKGIFVGLETLYKNIGIEVRLETKNFLARDENTSRKENTILIWLNYMLFKNQYSR